MYGAHIGNAHAGCHTGGGHKGITVEDSEEGSSEHQPRFHTVILHAYCFNSKGDVKCHYSTEAVRFNAKRWHGIRRKFTSISGSC